MAGGKTMTKSLASSAGTESSRRTASAKEAEGGGRYLTFFLAGEEYGLEILKVHEIIGMMSITPVPRTPEYVRGVINLRGKVIPVVDLRLKLDMPAEEATEQSCIIVVQANRRDIGIVVDRVSEVLTISGEDIEDTPSFGTSVCSDYILGIGKSEGKVKLLLDIDRVLQMQEVDITGSEVETDENAEETMPLAA